MICMCILGTYNTIQANVTDVLCSFILIEQGGKAYGSPTLLACWKTPSQVFEFRSLLLTGCFAGNIRGLRTDRIVSGLVNGRKRREAPACFKKDGSTGT